MTIKKEVIELVEKLQKLEIGSSEWEGIIDILKRKYEMSPWTILGLFDNPPTLEYTKQNRHLLLESENGVWKDVS